MVKGTYCFCWETKVSARSRLWAALRSGNFEREYIQLHRDSTIGQLTLTPQLEDGKIVWDDSPLISVVKNGSALVVDEADKAPVEVISVLKGLVEDGELLLADGRRIANNKEGPVIIPIHPDSSLWVLATDLPFHSLETISSGRSETASEMDLLRCYAPTMHMDIIRSIASSKDTTIKTIWLLRRLHFHVDD